MCKGESETERIEYMVKSFQSTSTFIVTARLIVH